MAEAGQNGVAAGTRSEEPGAVCLVTLVASECCMPCLRSLWRCVHWLGVVVSLTGMASSCWDAGRVERVLQYETGPRVQRVVDCSWPTAAQ